MVESLIGRPVGQPTYEFESSQTRRYSGDETIALIGFFGAGKRTLGVIAALAMRRHFIDFDKFFRQQTGSTPAEYIASHGSEAYRRTEIETVRDVLSKHRQRCIISGLGGMGSSELGQALREFGRTNPVVYIRRDRDELKNYINTSEVKFEQIYKVGNRFFESCSNFDFFNLSQLNADQDLLSTTLKLKDTERDFVRFLGQMFGRDQTLLRSIDPLSTNYTYALQTPLDWLESNQDRWEEVDRGADVINLTLSLEEGSVDDLLSRLARQMAVLRRCCRQPIILDISIPPTMTLPTYINFLRASFRVLSDMITISLSTEHAPLDAAIFEKGYVKLIGKYHEPHQLSEGWTKSSWPVLKEHAMNLKCTAVRVSFESNRYEDLRKWLSLSAALSESSEIPVTSYITGELGRATICLNQVLSPVVPESMKMVPSYGSGVTLAQAQSSLHGMFLTSGRKFTILGQSVNYSLSPAMHNAAYEACGLPHRFGSLQTEDFSQVRNLFQDKSCGGVTVSLPFKRDVLTLLDTISSDAEDIGAVNTVVVRHENPGDTKPTLHGYNTDYIGIRECISRSLSPANTIRQGTTALIIGAGGMARAAVYACHKLSIEEIVVYNRSLARAQDLADYFNTWAKNKPSTNLNITVLPSMQHEWPAHLRQPTVIVSCIPAHSIGGQSIPNLTLPEHWLQSRTGGVVIELAYKPLITPLIKQMRSKADKGWITVDGLHELVEQGIAQYELFTGRPAPVHVMRHAVRKQYERASGVSDRDSSYELT